MISRRAFVKFSAFQIAALGVPAPLFSMIDELEWPSLSLAGLPPQIANILGSVPDLRFDAKGYLSQVNPDLSRTPLPLRPTLWNQAHHTTFDSLLRQFPWAIVIHWFGDTEAGERDIDFYMRGFDDKKHVAEGLNSTSAHYLVGGAKIKANPDKRVSILQTQYADPQGLPYVASHLFYKNADSLPLNNYFVKAINELAWQDKTIRSGVLDIYSRRQVDPNYTTIAIEMAGLDFDRPEHEPSLQQIGNLIGLLWALMKNFSISAQAIIGHQELDLRKSDPGKAFLAYLRYLLGVKALVDHNLEMRKAVFGEFLKNAGSVSQAVTSYFQFAHNLLTYVAEPVQVFEWESETGYGLLMDMLQSSAGGAPSSSRLILPLETHFYPRGDNYLSPEGHEGIDIYTNPHQSDYRQVWPEKALLTAPGECLYAGKAIGCRYPLGAVFRHKQADGAEFVSIYGHLRELGSLSKGGVFPAGYPVGLVYGSGKADDGYLHYALAYYATWKIDLRGLIDPPASPHSAWIRSRYFSPYDYFVKMGAISKPGS